MDAQDNGHGIELQVEAAVVNDGKIIAPEKHVRTDLDAGSRVSK